METEIAPNEFVDAYERIRRFLTNENYMFGEYVGININSSHLIMDTEIRTLNEKHVQHLLSQMKKNLNNIYNILNQTPIIAFKHEEFVRIVDGNHRIAAVRLFNETQDEQHRIYGLVISFHVESYIPLQHKLKLMSLAESKIYQDKKPLDRYEIMKHSRFLLLKCPEILGLECLLKNASTVQQKKYGERVVAAVSEFFHVGHPSLVLRNIWKATRISDEDFELMYNCFPRLPSGFNVHDFDMVFNKYITSPSRITLLMTSDTHFNTIEEFRDVLRKHVKPELIPTLQRINCYDFNLEPEEHFEIIAGEEYFNKNGYNKTESILCDYLLAKRKNLRHFKKSDDKLLYLQRHFKEWLKNDQSQKQTSKKTDKPDNHDVNEVQIVSEVEVNPLQPIDIFINQLVQFKRESVAAFIVHYFLRPQNPEQTLPPFYFKYLKNDQFDLTQIPRDDGTIDDESTNFDHFDQYTMFKTATESNLTTREKQKRKSVIQNSSSSNSKKSRKTAHTNET